ncbi:sulfurtransferase complex subunit TusD [uncultured Ferrimonas sp.]|uniref:sulfurtransferase complex subunit TusD n=1 Tax=uncultured Ferrimonas sp. TaxID=432640 RepID=UPI002627113F|nr:sulfurtransferase complex subunit TusD [uncultured Ferrimonas sp.]
MSQFVVFVNGPAYGNQHAYTALRFCQAALTAGHTLTQVFFYQDGIHNASSLLSPASDEFAISQQWQQLAQQQVSLVCCVSAALRRGVLDDEAAADLDLPNGNIVPWFSLGGLGEYVTAAANADRVVQFG